MEVLIIALFFSFTVKMESYITFYIVQPLLKRLFGDNESLRREIEKQEEDLRKLVEQGKKNRPPTTREPVEVD